jgi:hypothetical protein
MYLLPFHNQYPDHDFSLISQTIKKYFPIDRPQRLTAETISSSPGFKKISKIVNTEYLNKKNYRAKWGKLTKRLERVFKKPVLAFPNLHDGGGGFNGEVVIEEHKDPDFLRQKSLHFYISTIGPFFAIHGVDRSTAFLEFDSRVPEFTKGKFDATHAITISPAFEYRETFNTLEEELREFFPAYSFIPYQVGMSTIKNISVEDELRDPRSMDTVYEALFGTRAVYDCLTRGDLRYGMNDWIKPLTKKEHVLLDRIYQHIINSPAKTTIHKVWKLQDSKRLGSINVPASVIFFGGDVFDVIDLTDKSRLIMQSGERMAPAISKYNITKDLLEIEITPNLSFRIIKVDENSLVLHLILDIDQKEFPIKGTIMEMTFVVMKTGG